MGQPGGNSYGVNSSLSYYYQFYRLGTGGLHKKAKPVRHKKAKPVRHKKAKPVRHKKAKPVRHKKAKPVRHKKAKPVRGLCTACSWGTLYSYRFAMNYIKKLQKYFR